MWKMILSVYVFLHFLSFTGAVRIIVKECPVTETAWQARSQMFECKSPQVYHCIQDNEGNLMEICMRAYPIKPFYEGGCPWASYSTDEETILSSLFHPCNKIECPQKNDSNYWTNQLYKYPICLHYKQTTEITASTTPLLVESAVDDNAVNESDGIIIAIALTAIGMIVVFIVIITVWKFTRRLNCRRMYLKCFVDEVAIKEKFPTVCSDVEEDPNLTDPLILGNSAHGMDEHKNSTSTTEPEIHAVSGIYVEDHKSTDFLILTDERTDLTKMLLKFQGNGHQMESSEEGLSKTIIPYLTPDCNGRTLVHKACFEGKTSLVKNLIRTHGDIFCNIKDNKGMTLLHLAGFSGSVELVQYLLENGCNLNSMDISGQTIVHIACQEGHVSLLKYLTNVDKSVIYTKDKNGMTAFHCAGFSGSFELVKYLIDIGAELCCQDFEGRTVVHISCEKGQVDLLKLFISTKKEVLDVKDKDGMTPFHFAGFSGSVGLVQYLIDNGCDLYSKNTNGQTIAHIACSKGHISLMKYLIDKDKGVLEKQDKNGFTPVHFAGLLGSVELVQYFRDNGCDIYSKSKSGQTIAHIACGKGHVKLMKYLRDMDRDVLEMKDNNGSTPFHFAARSGSVELVQYLYDEGCDIYSKETNGQTIAHTACGKGHLNIMQYLTDLDNGVLKIPDNDGLTPFHFAGFSGSVELVHYLVDKGCDIYSKSTNGQTIAHIACGEGFVNLMEYLIGLDKGILEIKDNYEFTPFDFARFFGYVKLTEYLRDLIEKKNVTEVDTDTKEIDKDRNTFDKHMTENDKGMLKRNKNVMDIDTHMVEMVKT